VTVDLRLRTETLTGLSAYTGQNINIQVQAVTIAGDSTSDTLTVTVAAVPSKPVFASNDESTRDTISVTINEYVSPSTPILSYEFSIDDGLGGSFTTFAGGSTFTYLSLTAETSTGIQEGYIYRVRCRARNINGWGDYSDTLLVTAAATPGIIDPVTTSYSEDKVVFTWNRPTKGALEISAYYVIFLTKAGDEESISE